MSYRRVSVVLASVLLAMASFSCSPAPRHTLTTEEKISDLYWIYSQFRGNYAPLEYKQQRFGFNYETLKAQYLRAAEDTRTNEEFYRLMHRFVAEFRDAHTSSTLMASTLPSRTEIAYLGFDGVRSGDGVVVTKLLPTINPKSYPLKVGDKILKLDGVALPEVVRTEMVRLRDLGQDEANLTYHMNRIFSRMSLVETLPGKDTAVLTIVREKKEREVSLPWIVRDLVTFTKEQEEAAAEAKKQEEKKKESSRIVEINGIDAEQFFKFGFLGAQGEIDLVPSLVRKIARGIPGFRFWDTFVFVDTLPTWSSKILSQAIGVAAGSSEAPVDELKRERDVPKNALFLPEAQIYPAYITPEKVIGKDGKETGARRYVGYIYLNTFGPQAGDENALEEIRKTLKTLQGFGVRDLVIDMLNNGGGSLKLGLQIAQLLSPERILLPEIQLKVSETWLDEFETMSLNASDDLEREIGRRVYANLLGDLAAGKTLSDRHSVEALFPLSVTPDPELDQEMRVVLLVNEMCASMCDIFSAVMKDNDRARIVGSRTMGAGGNVVVHFQAPNSHLILNQTESLMVRKDGSFIENNGVEPDFAMAVHESVIEKYDPVRQKAIELLIAE